MIYNKEHDDDLSSLISKDQLHKISSHNPLSRIRRNLLINMIWAAIMCIGYIIIIFYFRIWQVQVGIPIVLVFSLWALFTAFIQYRKIDTAVSAQNSLLSELKRHFDSISNWIRIQKRMVLFIYPISAASEFMLGGVIGSGKSVETFMNKPVVILALFITILILMPAASYTAKWLFKKSFGKHLDDLKENIDSLEEEKK